MSMNMFHANHDILAALGKNTTMEWKDKHDRAFFSAGTQPGKFAAKARGFRSRLFDMHEPTLEIVEATRPLRDMVNYRYLIYAYGRCGWSRRLHELAFFPSVILLEQSNCSEYFMDAFEVCHRTRV
jgi:hypothetical protein